MITIGAKVIKRGGDYRFVGVVVAEFTKLDGTTARYVVENDDGVLHIFSASQLEPFTDEPAVGGT